MRFSLLVAVAFILGVTAQPEPPPPSGEPADAANTAAGPAKTQTVEEYLKLHPQIETWCKPICLPFTNPGDKDTCYKGCIMRNYQSLGLPEPQFGPSQ